MHIENADPRLATFVKRAIAREMAKALKEDRINLDDDGAVAQALYDKTFSTISIAHLMDDAKAIARRSLVAVPPILFAATAAILISGAVSHGSVDTIAAIRRVESGPRAEAFVSAPRVSVAGREAKRG